MMTSKQEQPPQKYTIEETGRQLREILAKVEAVVLLFRDMSRDQLLELWMKRDEAGHYGDAVHQFALIVALERFHATHCPLYPYDLGSDKERFALLPSPLRAQTEKRVRAHIEGNAAYAFAVLDRRGFGFLLDEEARTSGIERRVREEMEQSGHKYWRK
jgi:hypothetical protein